MPKVSDISIGESFNILGMGVSGTGKTRFAGTLPEPRYIFNFEPENLITLRAEGIDADYDDITSWAQFESKLLSFEREAQQGKLSYKSIIVDGGNALYLTGLYSITGGKKPTLPDWGQGHERYKQTIKRLKALPCVFYMTFHEVIEKDEVTGETRGRILLIGTNLPDEIPPLFNMVFRFIAVPQPNAKPKRMVRTAPDSRWPGNDRTGALAYEEEPDFSKMLLKIQAKINNQNGGSQNASTVQPA